jgi:hypothetical protein
MYALHTGPINAASETDHIMELEELITQSTSDANATLLFPPAVMWHGIR